MVGAAKQPLLTIWSMDGAPPAVVNVGALCGVEERFLIGLIRRARRFESGPRDMTSKYSYEPRTRAQFHRDPQAQKLLRQFMKNGGEGGGAGRTDEFRAGYVYAFEMSEEEKRAVDALRAENEGLSLAQAVSLVEMSREKP